VGKRNFKPKKILTSLYFYLKLFNPMIRKATAVWNGTGKEGKGHLTTDSTVLDKTQYSFHTRFEDGKGTNPEELVAAAHAGCFAMKLSFNLSGANFPPKELDVTSNITFEEGTLKKSHLVLKAQVDGISEEQFAELVKDAEKNCPISRALNMEISVEYTLNA
jgi:lipoyl-dependent peroxiredoxin